MFSIQMIIKSTNLRGSTLILLRIDPYSTDYIAYHCHPLAQTHPHNKFYLDNLPRIKFIIISNLWQIGYIWK